MKLSLHQKLTFFSAVVIGVTLALFALLTARHLHREGVQGLDRDLTRQAKNVLRTLNAPKRSKVNLSDPHVVEDLFQRAKWNYFIEIEQDGKLAFRSANCENTPLPAPAGGKGCYTGRFREKNLRLGIFRRQGTTLRLGASLEYVEEVSDDLLISFAVTLPLALLALGVGAWQFSRRALKPVVAIVSAAEQITAQRLHERLPVPAANDEIRHLALVFNRMFDRLESSFQQAARFTADASHELKTPLTIIRGELEAALHGNTWSPKQERFFLGLLDETERLSMIMESLLLLSRADAGKLQLCREPVNLSQLLEDLHEDAEVLCAPKDISVQSDIAPGITLRADARLVRQMLLNPLHNAVKYNARNGFVRLAASAREGTCRIVIANSGPGISPEQSERVFDRFYRGDAAREGDGGHGLGLSIAREIARAHHGDVVLAANEPGYTEFVVSLPLTNGNGK